MVHFFDSHIAQKYGVNAAVLAGFLWDYALKRLIRARVLTKGRFNESCFDRTNWYAFTEFGQFLMTESEGQTK